MPIQALNESGQPVDWFFAYKVARLAGENGASGYEYAYADSLSDVPSASPHRLDQGSGAVHETLAQVGVTGSSFILYNDEKPDGTPGGPDDESLGHTKGVICWDTASKTGFLLVHSWPKFPVPGGKAAPTPIYGQTFLCLSLSLDTLGLIAAQMLCHQEPQVYSAGGVEPVTVDVPQSLFDLWHKDLTPHPHPAFDVLDLTTLGGMPFKLFAKNREWGGDFWNDGVGSALGVDLDVETWIRGEIAPTADKDGIHRVADIKFVSMQPVGMPYTFSEAHDHAKWAISADAASPWVLVGDINRMVSQRKRGGGCVGFQNPRLHNALSRMGLVIAAPGMSTHETHAHIKTSHKKAS